MELKNTPYKLRPLARIIAYKLYVLYVNDDARDRLELEEVASLFSISISRNLLKTALEILRKDHCISRTENKNDGYKYKVSEAGLLLIENALRRKDSDISYFARNGDGALEDLAGPNSTWMTVEERLDENPWLPLQIDRQDPEYLSVIETVDAAIERIRGDNAFAQELPKEREGFLSTLEDGADWLRNKRPTKQQIVDKLVKPLWAFTARFRNSVMAEVATTAARALIEWLGRF